MKNTNQNQKDIAISVGGVSKQFTIPHEKINSLRGAFVNMFKRNGSESFYALKDISFEVKKGEFFGILGRNGSGKSTLLKILAGVYTADKGKIDINGLVSPFLELGIGFNPELSGRDNIYLNATVLGLTERQIDEKFDSIVAFSELERFIDQKVKNYSSGMQVRLAFSVALHANREILLMDEVLAVGDSNFQSKCLREFARYKEMGKTVILVTHDIGTVQRYCDRAMLLRNGEIAMIGSAEEVGNEYIYQNMSDEEKRLLKEQERAKKKAEEDRVKAERESLQEKRRQEAERIRAEREAERLKGKAREEELKRLEEEKRRLEEEKKRQDEERKKAEEEARRLEEERKNKVAEIVGVEFLDKDGKDSSLFNTGSPLIIRTYYKNNRAPGPINVGVGIHSSFGVFVCGYNTLIDEFSLDRNSNSVELCFNNLPLLKGEYIFNITLFGTSKTEIFDFKGKVKMITVFSLGKDNQYGGLVSLPHMWKN